MVQDITRCCGEELARSFAPITLTTVAFTIAGNATVASVSSAK